MKKLCLLVFSAFVCLTACIKETPKPNTDTKALNEEIISSFAENVARADYSDLANKSIVLNDNIQTLSVQTTEAQFNICKENWRNCRAAWEMSEGFLFGPVATENIDPRIDTWPVNYVDLEGVLKSNAEFTPKYIDSLEDALKGFHPIEYLLFGQNGNKKASDLTPREKEYLVALAFNLKTLTTTLAERWNPNMADNYHNEFTSAGTGSSAYTSQKAAFEELVNAMTGICDEVANGKIGEPFLKQDATLEESPFSGNSLTDFTNNLKSVQIVYTANYTTDGKGLEDLVRANNLSLDNNIKLKLNTAIAALGNITVPFGRAITEQPVQVQNAIDAINVLKTEIEDNLLPFVRKYAK